MTEGHPESDRRDSEPPPEQVRHRPVSARVPESVSTGVLSTGVLVITGVNEFVLDFVLRMTRPHQIVARVVLPHAVMPRLVSVLRQNIAQYERRFGSIASASNPAGQGAPADQPDAQAAAESASPQPPPSPDAPPSNSAAAAATNASEPSPAAPPSAERADAPIEELAQPPSGPRRASVEEVYNDLKLPDELLSGVYANAVMIGHMAGTFSFDFLTSFYPRSSVSARVFLPAPHVPALLASLDNARRHLPPKRPS